MSPGHLEQRIRDAGHVVTLAGEVDDETAAAVLGIAPHTLANHRARGCSPPFRRRRRRVWYSIDDLAAELVRSRVVPLDADSDSTASTASGEHAGAMRQITLTVPAAVLDQLAELADRDGVTVRDIIDRAIVRELDLDHEL